MMEQRKRSSPWIPASLLVRRSLPPRTGFYSKWLGPLIAGTVYLSAVTRRGCVLTGRIIFKTVPHRAPSEGIKARPRMGRMRSLISSLSCGPLLFILPFTPPLPLSATIPLLPVIIKVFRSEERMNYRRHRQGLWFGRREWKITPLFPSSIACLMKSKSRSHNQKRALCRERDLMWFVTFLFRSGD